MRAEIELGCPGYLLALPDIDNPFAKFRVYRFSSERDQGAFGTLICAARQKGMKRALAMLKNDKDLAAKAQLIVDGSRAPWWNPELLWQAARISINNLFGSASSAVPLQNAA